MRKVDKIVIHCSATREGQAHNAKDIDRWHKAQGWNGIGYHHVVLLDGTVEKGRDESLAGSHVKGFNATSIGVVYIGGLAANGVTPKDTRTDAQKVALAKLIKELKAKYPGAKVMGHRDLSPDKDKDGVVEPHEWLKACPSFDVSSWLKEVGI
jgi:N-acetylmuramoyl-L-alanine amidase